MRSDAIAAVIAGLSLTTAFIPKGDSGRGKAVYDRYCTQCHGVRGDGAGEVAPYATPKPRDFRQGLFKFRSTPFGALPTEDDLDRTISNGLYGTAMPPFYALNPGARRDVIAYIETFSPRWRNEKPGEPISVPTEPASTNESATRGRDLFAKTCAACHGDGSGNGPLAKSLVDAWGNPDPPANLRKRLKSVRDGRDIYVRLMTGLNGTPMPGFAGSLSPDQAWDLVHFIESGDSSTIAMAPSAPVPATGDVAATIEMVSDASGAKFVPNSVTIHVGQSVRFVNKIGGPHNVTFWPDSIPGGAQQKLQSNMGNTSGPLTGPLLINSNDGTTVSFAGVPAGTYKFYCMPHLALGMKGQIIVQ